MAKFNAAYGLCSVIDSRGLLGVSEDEDGTAVVTLGKNMVIRCRISDQRQLNSWSTRISKLTSHVVYDSINENYVGVFDGIHIKQWTASDSSIEKVKKRTMKSEVHEILLHKKTSFSKPSLFVLFKNGSCIEMESVLEAKEELPGIIQPDETIQSGKIIHQQEKFLVILARFQKKYYVCYTAKLEENRYCIIPETVKKVKLRRQGVALLGYCILQEDKGNSLITCWSDGFMYSLPLPIYEEKIYVGNFIGTIHTFSKKCQVAMIPVSFTQIAFYASDLSQEGAFLGIYNIKFGLFQAQTTFKLFNKPPRIWLIENNIVILMGQRLVCVPFTLQAELLSALVCSRALHNKPPLIAQEISAVIPNVKWEKTKKETLKDEVEPPQKIKELLSVCSSEGWSEYGICKFLLNKLLETNDYNAMDWCLRTFIDIPEDFIVKLLKLGLTRDDDDDDVIVMDDEIGNGDKGKSFFLKRILQMPINDGDLLTSLRRHFKFEDCLALLEYFCSEENGEADSNVFLWIILLLDAFYQQFLLSRDSKVFEIMVKLGNRIENEIEGTNKLKNLLPLLISVKRGKEIVKAQSHSRSYSIEKFRLYE